MKTRHEQTEEIISSLRMHRDQLGGFDQLYTFINELYAYIQKMPEMRTQIISPMAEHFDSFFPKTAVFAGKLSTKDKRLLITKTIGLFICENNLNISFINDTYTRFRKQYTIDYEFFRKNPRTIKFKIIGEL